MHVKLVHMVAHNCHIKTKCFQQVQITHNKFKTLTAENSNHSQQLQKKMIITNTFEMFVCYNIRNVKSNYLKCIGSQCFPLPCLLFFLSNFDGRGTRVSMIPCSQVYNDTAENT